MHHIRQNICRVYNQRMEICDLYDETGKRTGKTAPRGTKLAAGEYYLVVQVWIRNESGEYLVQRRALHLAVAPGVWATTAGAVQAGEESISGAIRETMEELGIALTPEQLRLFERLNMKTQLEDVWIATISQDSTDHLALGSEVAAWKWATKHQLQQSINAGDFFAYSYFDALPD